MNTSRSQEFNQISQNHTGDVAESLNKFIIPPHLLKQEKNQVHYPSAVQRGRKERNYILPGLKHKKVGMLVAPGGIGKTWLTYAIGVGLGLHSPIAGGVWPKAGNPYKTLLITAEDDCEDLEDRMISMVEWITADRELDMSLDQVLTTLWERFHIISWANRIPTLITANQVINEEVRKEIVELAKHYDLVMIDPIARFNQADENISAVGTLIVQVMQSIANEGDCAVLFTHHTNKSSLATGGEEASAARGSSALTNGVRWQANMSGMSEEDAKRYGIDERERHQYVRLNLSKVNVIERDYGKWLMRESSGVLRRVDLFPLSSALSASKRSGPRRDRSETNGRRSPGTLL